jgi:hypothetical protein
MKGTRTGGDPQSPNTTNAAKRATVGSGHRPPTLHVLGHVMPLTAFCGRDSIGGDWRPFVLVMPADGKSSAATEVSVAKRERNSLPIADNISQRSGPEGTHPPDTWQCLVPSPKSSIATKQNLKRHSATYPSAIVECMSGVVREV